MNINKNQSQNKGTFLLIFLCWLVYSTSYLGKVNYSANITEIMDFYKVTKAEAGLVPTFFFFSYGIGQVVNGILCKKYNTKWSIFISLFLSGAANLAVAVTPSFAVIKWFWIINGFALSILWPTLIRILSETIPRKSLKRATATMGTAVATGTLIVYALSSVLAIFEKFKLSFFFAGFAAISVAIIWIILTDRAIKGSLRLKTAEAALENPASTVNAQKKTSSSYFNKKALYSSIIALAIFSVGVNLIKDGLTTWVPSILKEEFGFTDSLSILLTLLLPLLALFANLTALQIHKKISDYVTHCFVTFMAIGILILGIMGCLSLKLALPMLIALVLSNFLASTLNSLITSVFPIFMRDKVNSGLFAGVLNGFCYLGSTISSYGLGAIADKNSWQTVFTTLFVFCMISLIIWVTYKLINLKRGI